MIAKPFEIPILGDVLYMFLKVSSALLLELKLLEDVCITGHRSQNWLASVFLGDIG